MDNLMIGDIVRCNDWYGTTGLQLKSHGDVDFVVIDTETVSLSGAPLPNHARLAYVVPRHHMAAEPVIAHWHRFTKIGTIAGEKIVMPEPDFSLEEIGLAQSLIEGS